MSVNTQRPDSRQWRALARRGARVARLARYVLEDAAGLAADVAFAIRGRARLWQARRRAMSGNPGQKNK